MFKKISQMQILAIRPKINGEKFVVTKKRGLIPRMMEGGFARYELPAEPPLELVEYYAGNFYVLHPVITKRIIIMTQKVDDRGRKAPPVSTVFHPHPRLTVEEYVQDVSKYKGHKYDGFMLWLDQGEIRVKWEPSKEVVVREDNRDVVWEMVLYGNVPRLLRPRQAKVAQNMENAKAWIRSEIPGRVVLDYLRSGVQKVPYSEKLRSKHVRQGAKCFFLSQNNSLLAIKEPHKPVDLIGGQVEYGELPIEAMIREKYEETGIRMKSSQFLLLGESCDGGFPTQWVSFVYLAMAPDQLTTSRKDIVEYPFQFPLSHYKEGFDMTQWQVWMPRHMDFLVESFCYCE